MHTSRMVIQKFMSQQVSCSRSFIIPVVWKSNVTGYRSQQHNCYNRQDWSKSLKGVGRGCRGGIECRSLSKKPIYRCWHLAVAERLSAMKRGITEAQSRADRRSLPSLCPTQ